MEHFHLTTDLISKVDEVEFRYTQDRMNVIRDFSKRTRMRAICRGGAPERGSCSRCAESFFNRILLSGIVFSTRFLERRLDAYQAMERLWMSKSALARSMRRRRNFFKRGFRPYQVLPVFLKPVRELTTRRSDSLAVKQVSSSMS